LSAAVAPQVPPAVGPPPYPFHFQPGKVSEHKQKILIGLGGEKNQKKRITKKQKKRKDKKREEKKNDSTLAFVWQSCWHA
jgi:hypothetical protein